MRISIIGPNTPIPPKGWGAVESLIWDYKITLEKLGHEVQIINIGDPMQILGMIDEFKPDLFILTMMTGFLCILTLDIHVL